MILEKLRRKPEKEKIKILVVSTIIIMAIVLFISWFDFSNEQENTENNGVSVFQLIKSINTEPIKNLFNFK